MRELQDFTCDIRYNTVWEGQDETWTAKVSLKVLVDNGSKELKLIKSFPSREEAFKFICEQLGNSNE